MRGIDLLSPELTVSMNVLSMLRSPSSMPSPKAMKSTATLFFLSFLARRTMYFSSAP